MTTGSLIANNTLHYTDDTQAELPLRAGVELPGYAGQDQHVALTFASDKTLPMLGLEPEPLVSPRLPNPHPERTVRCVDFTTVDVSAPSALLGLTLEPPAGAPAVLPRSTP
jgi:hypothetical protein